MGALSFQKRFVSKVESGEKQHTIRAMRKRPFCAGDTLSLYYGMRTKSCRLLLRRTCTAARDLFIDRTGVISVDGVELTLDEMETLAVLDGFESYAAMLWFWQGRLPFVGQIVHWKFDEVKA